LERAAFTSTILGFGMMTPVKHMIEWPERYDPARAPVHVRNELESSATPEAVWAWLVRASLWPSWYPNSKNVRIDGGSSTDLVKGSSFTWRTFGVAIRSTVLEFEPPQRIAWNGFGIGVDVYHAWLITSTTTGSHLLTEESQYGWAARLSSRLFPTRMSRFHQLWIERLSDAAQGGPPPVPTV
jgi:uncharacterized protein YndB with AHSA1/START domain